MKVHLSEEHQAFVQSAVAAGTYATAEDAVADALRLLQEREAEMAAKFERLRAAVGEGADQLDRGEYSSSTVIEILAESERRKYGDG